MQALLIRLIQQEFTLLLPHAAGVTDEIGAALIRQADPALLYFPTPEPTVRLCPLSHQLLLVRLDWQPLPG